MSTKIGITKTQEANLRKGAAYLLSGDIAMRFNMAVYCTKPDLKDDEFLKPAQHTCGTVGCAAGHFPAAGIKPFNAEFWNEYITRTTGFNPFCYEWEWCFGPDWRDVDNTPEGAAKRILWLLDKDLPEDWEEQQGGSAPLCYNEA